MGTTAAVGVPLVIIGVLLATGHLHGRRKKVPVPAGPGGQRPKKEGWAQRVLREPRPGLAVLIGALCGTPGALYITALHDMVTGNSSTATQAVAVGERSSCVPGTIVPTNSPRRLCTVVLEWQ